jgi:hopanoid-associated phosphorylase
VKPLGFVCGMVVEAACIDAASKIRQQQARIHITGGVADSAAEGARAHVAAGVRALVSFGLAGGLDPSLSPGDLVGGTFVWRADGPPIDAAALDGDMRFVAGGIAGVDAPVVSVAAKTALRAASRAIAVDMESHAVAAVAAAAGLPFYVVRAIADPASRAVPAAALAGLGPDGRRQPFGVLVGLLVNPAQIPGIVRLAGDSRAALRSLARAAPIILSGA